MTPEFRAAKNTIRGAVAGAPRETVESILAAAREGRVPYWGTVSVMDVGSDIDNCGCIAQRISGDRYYTNHGDLSLAYCDLADGAEYSGDADRQRILVAICRADLRRRDREAVMALVESAEPTRRDLLRKATWAAPTMTLLLSASTASARMSEWGPYGIKALGRPVR